ncbi:MAG: magnesium/cobalt transporter CorA [Gammaproteobacteria bacterium]|nr:magnesium/cobalt transporter CorA [Gammaproteobacteria bacterium]
MSYFTKRYHPPGTAPGTLVKRKKISARPLLISIIDYDATHLQEVTDATAQQCKLYLSQPTVTWVHVHGHAEPEVLRELGAIFDLHPLAMEDVLNTGQRPKAESYDGQLFAITSLPVFASKAVRTEQISVFAGESYVVSFHEGKNDPFEPIRKRLRKDTGRLRTRKADYLLYALLDIVIDQGFPVLEAFGEQIDSLENALLRNPDKRTLTALHHLKRELLLLRRMLWPQREVLNILLRDEQVPITNETKLYLRDCYDHTIQIMDLIETYRDMTASMLDIYLSSVSNRLNEVMRVLTVIATVFIPPTFVVGVYGMNFDRSVSRWNMPELGWSFGYLFVWSVMALMIGGMLLYVKRKKWF